ncbi:MAG: transketolase, partial [Bacteroidetes bacterium]
MPKKNVPTSTQAPYFHSFSRESVHQDFYYSCLSRELSRLLRREVLTGKAKFGAGSAGKELPQVVVARVFEPGDFYSGYYRDQSFMLAKELATPQQFFTMLYGDADREAFSGGRQMINHYSTPLVDAEGNWLELKEQLNVAASLSPVAGQITHAIGIAAASKAYRQNSRLSTQTPFSNNGREVSFCISGDAAAAEGIFFEAINAAGVMQIPLAFVILDDGYGISVPTEYQVTKGNISKILEGFRRKEGENGIDLYTL